VRQDRALLDDLEERQHEVARDAEQLSGAVVLQAAQERGRERRPGLGASDAGTRGRFRHGSK
jgi:hypothetical protein